MSGDLVLRAKQWIENDLSLYYRCNMKDGMDADSIDNEIQGDSLKLFLHAQSQISAILNDCLITISPGHVNSFNPNKLSVTGLECAASGI